MVLRMACPTKRQGSDNWYFRRQIPADVRAILEGLPKSQRPVNWYRTHISISLKTADRAAAKALCPEIAARVESQMATLRAGPCPLSHKQVVALSGELYKAFAEGLEDNPRISAEAWRKVAEDNEAARRGDYGLVARLGIHSTATDRRRASLDKRFGAITDAFLRKRGIITDGESRQKLIEHLSIDLSEAAKKLARNAEGDYSPDEYVKRFPKLERNREGSWATIP